MLQHHGATASRMLCRGEQNAWMSIFALTPRSHTLSQTITLSLNSSNTGRMVQYSYHSTPKPSLPPSQRRGGCYSCPRVRHLRSKAKSAKSGRTFLCPLLLIILAHTLTQNVFVQLKLSSSDGWNHLFTRGRLSSVASDRSSCRLEITALSESPR